jgi:uncharacterized protein YciI
MLFFVYCIDKPGGVDIRLANREAHIGFAKSHADKLVIGGPTLTEDGASPTGSVYIADFPDRKTLEEHLANDPYAKAGLFEAVIIRPYRKTLP